MYAAVAAYRTYTAHTVINMNLKPMSKWDTKKPPFTCYTFESEGKLTASKNRISNEWKTKWNFQFSVAIQNKLDSQYFLLYFLLLFIHIHMTIVLNDWVREKVVVSASIVFAYNSFISYDINRIECCQGVTRYLFKYYTIEKKKKKKIMTDTCKGRWYNANGKKSRLSPVFLFKLDKNATTIDQKIALNEWKIKWYRLKDSEKLRCYLCLAGN